MMKNKFIIGDIVKEGVIEFINFSGNEYAIKREGEFIIVTTDPEPLPLTYDFFIEHGFKITDFIDELEKPIYKNKISNFEIHVSEMLDNSFEIVVDNAFIIDLRYVHEYQHLLFGLGIEL